MEPTTAQSDQSATTVSAPEPIQDVQDGAHASEGMRELEAMASDEAAPLKPEKSEKPKPKKAEKIEIKAPEAKKPVEPVPDLEEPEPEAEKPVKATELRAAYEKSKTEIKSKDAEITRLNGELRKAKETPRDDPEKRLLVEKFEAADKKRQALEQELKVVAYQRSGEFVEKYKKPYEEAWQKAVEEISEFTVELEDGSQRVATAKDLLALSQMAPADARKLAKQMFGEAADEVMAHRRKIRELSDAQNKALADAEKNSETFHKERETKSVAERQKTVTLWQDENKRWTEKFPSFFAPKEGDEEGNALLAKGYEMADKAFSSNGDTSPEERVRLHAELRNKAAAFPRLALQLKKARARIKELETGLSQYEESEPKSGEGGKARTAKPANELMDAYGELDQLSKK